MSEDINIYIILYNLEILLIPIYQLIIRPTHGILFLKARENLKANCI